MLEILVAFSICIINFLSGIIIYHIAIKKEIRTFAKIFFSSLILRYVINMFFILLFLKYLNFNALNFSLTYLIGTYVFILIEVIYFNSQQKFLILLNNKNENSK